ncbi:MAG TPA: ABC transporter permease [Actinomycetota bacterium]|nr:ABC transporter permease [Actinomycetota bacterium]
MTRLDRHVRVYRSLLRLYPWRFRREYGWDMCQVFRDRLREELRTGQPGRLAAYWFSIVLDVVRTAIPERIAAIVHVRRRDLAPHGGRAGVFRYVIRRLIFSIPVLLVSSILVFVVIRSTIDPLAGCQINPRQNVENCIRLRHEYGLDRPLHVQYWKWLSHFARGDWGTSLLSNRPVLPDIRSALANTAVLGLVATGFALFVGVGVGLYSSLKQYSMFDNVATGAAFVGLSIPNFWFALLLQIFFGVYLTKWLHLTEPIFYTAGLYKPGQIGFNLIDRVRHLILPMLVLSVQIIAYYSRYMRASMLEVLHSDYLRTARAKGLRERRVIVRHAMRNALIPLTTQVALDVGAIAGGLIITEAIFEYPGMGRFFIDAVARGDYQQVLPWLMVAVTFVILFNLVADVLYAILDPRIRYA